MGDSYTPLNKWIERHKGRHMRKLSVSGDKAMKDPLPAINPQLEKVRFDGSAYPSNATSHIGKAITGIKGNRYMRSRRYIKKPTNRKSTLRKQHSKPSPKSPKFKHAATADLFDTSDKSGSKVVTSNTGRKFTVDHRVGKKSKKKRRTAKRKRRKTKRRRKPKNRRKTNKRRKQRGGMATLAEAYGGTNLASVTNNVSNGIEGMSAGNPYGTNDRSSFSSKVGSEHEKQQEANKEQVAANKATKKGQVGGMATLAEAYGGTSSGFETVTTGVTTGMGSIFEGNTGNTGKKGVAVPQYKGAPGANENIIKAAKLGEQTKENRKYDTIQKGGSRKKRKKRNHKGGCGCQERF